MEWNMNNNEIFEIHQMHILNKRLLSTLYKIGFDLAHFAEKYGYQLPSDFPVLLEETENLIHALNHHENINKSCSICGKLNLENAEFCCYCGSSLIITRVRQLDDTTRKRDRTPNSNFYIEVFTC